MVGELHYEYENLKLYKKLLEYMMWPTSHGIGLELLSRGIKLWECVNNLYWKICMNYNSDKNSIIQSVYVLNLDYWLLFE